jgi:hypothetical protein
MTYSYSPLVKIHIAAIPHWPCCKVDENNASLVLELTESGGAIHTMPFGVVNSFDQLDAALRLVGGHEGTRMLKPESKAS